MNFVINKLGISAVIIAVLAIIASAALAYQRLQERLPRPQVSVTNIPVVKYNARDIKRFEQYSSVLDNVLDLRGDTLAEASLQMFGYHDAETLAQVDFTEQVFVLSMVYASGDTFYAVINDNLYKPGDSLPDGSKVVEIGMNGVTVVNQGLANLLTIDKQIDAPLASRPAPRRRVEAANPGQDAENLVDATRRISEIQRAMKVLQEQSRDIQNNTINP